LLLGQGGHLKYQAAVLTWIAIPVSLGWLLTCLASGVSVSYHPNAPGSHLFGPRLIGGVLGFIVIVILAFRHASKERINNPLGNLIELALVPIAMVASLVVYGVLLPQAPNLKISYRQETYAIPRVYRPSGHAHEKNRETLSIEYCINTLEPVYAAAGRCLNGRVDMSNRPILDDFDATFTLDNASARYLEDRIIDPGPSGVWLSDHELTYSQNGQTATFVLDETKQVIQVRTCNRATPLLCSAIVRLGNQNLFFRAAESDDLRSQADTWAALIKSWRCAEPTCGGQFTE
jgi:hypothetical protein